jgi:rhodanese-related sulfurtransferase
VLTGDTLFIGDVGRPDLLASAGWSPDELARRLYRSLHYKLLTLPDSTRVFPAHGAGSACGKAMSAAPESTIGEQRVTNYALRPMSEDAFVDAVTQGQSVAPLYFAFAAGANRHRHELLDDDAPPDELDLAGLEEWARKGAVVIDARPLDAFASGHFRGSINVSLDGRFAEYAGDVARPGQPIVVVCDPGRQTEAKVGLARIGFDTIAGAVSDIDQILTDRPDLAERSNRLAPLDLVTWRADASNLQLVDVRSPAEQDAGRLEGARSIPLAVLLDRLDELDQTAPTVVYCAGGYRSAVAVSLLRAHGFAHVADILGGYEAWRDAGLPTVVPDDLTTVS